MDLTSSSGTFSSTLGVGAGDGRAASIVEWTRAAGLGTCVRAGVAACVGVVVGGTPWLFISDLLELSITPLSGWFCMCHALHFARVRVSIFSCSPVILIPLLTRTHRKSTLPITHTRHGRFARDRKLHTSRKEPLELLFPPSKYDLYGYS